MRQYFRDILVKRRIKGKTVACFKWEIMCCKGETCLSCNDLHVNYICISFVLLTWTLITQNK